MNTGGPASEKTLRDEFAGQALVGMCSNPGGPIQANGMTGWGFANCNADYIAGTAYDLASAMLAEKARREAVVQQSSTTLPAREVDDDYWAKFKDGIIITFEPTMGWCASIREGSMGSGNTIAEAVANLRACWENWNAVKEPATDHSGDANKMVPDHSPDAGNMLRQLALDVLPAEIKHASAYKPLGWCAERVRAHVNTLAERNKELVEALDSLEVWGDELSANVNPPNRNCSCHINPPCNDCVDFTGQREAKQGWEDAKNNARAILAKHKGAA